MSVCHSCSHDTPHDAGCGVPTCYCDTPKHCEQCPCTLGMMLAAKDAYRKGAEEALRRIASKPAAWPLVHHILAVRKEMVTQETAAPEYLPCTHCTMEHWECEQGRSMTGQRCCDQCKHEVPES